MHIEITDNELRLLAKSFMIGSNTKKQKFVKYSKYKVIHPKYGELGIIECQELYKKHLHEIKDTESLIITGGITYQQDEQKAGALKLDVYHLGTFRFVRRIDEAFEKLLKDKLPSAGIAINIAQSLF